MSDRLDALEARMHYSFHDRSWLERALTHASYGDGRRKVRNNERLEFLGDRVLGLLTAHYVFTEFDQVDEGGLAPRLNAVVRKEACARAAERAGLGEALRMSRAEERSGGREKATVLGDACEAMLGAIYLDGGMEAAKRFYDRFFEEERAALKVKPKDPKTELQEWALSKGLGVPNYNEVARTGPDHRPVFTVEVGVPGYDAVCGEGGSKQAAERAAAELFLKGIR
jgi:ribonuclease-3